MVGVVEEKVKGKRGGRRIGAGRKKTGRKLGGPHRARPPLLKKHPVHVVLRTTREFQRHVGTLRQRCFYEAIRRVLVRYLEGENFRVVHISIQKNHLHLLVEAANGKALSRGMQSFNINAARAINGAWGRSGKVFAFRYHATQIKSDRYARNALSYVLNNWRRHREDFANGRLDTARLDEYSSAISFTGWTLRFGTPSDPTYEPLPVSPPRTSLLREDWKLYGLISHDETPGPIY